MYPWNDNINTINITINTLFDGVEKQYILDFDNTPKTFSSNEVESS